MTHNRMPLAVLMRDYRPGSGEWGWQHEAHELWTDQTATMAALAVSIARYGVTMPILLGDDGRVWDGHHRILAATAALISDLPVEYGHGSTETPLVTDVPLAEIADEIERQGREAVAFLAGDSDDSLGRGRLIGAEDAYKDAIRIVRTFTSVGAVLGSGDTNG